MMKKVMMFVSAILLANVMLVAQAKPAVITFAFEDIHNSHKYWDTLELGNRQHTFLCRTKHFKQGTMQFKVYQGVLPLGTVLYGNQLDAHNGSEQTFQFTVNSGIKQITPYLEASDNVNVNGDYPGVICTSLS